MEYTTKYAKSVDEVNKYLDETHGIEYAPDDEITYLNDDAVAQFDCEENNTIVCTVFKSLEEDDVLEEIIIDPIGWEKHPDQRL